MVESYRHCFAENWQSLNFQGSAFLCWSSQAGGVELFWLRWQLDTDKVYCPSIFTFAPQDFSTTNISQKFSPFSKILPNDCNWCDFSTPWSDNLRNYVKAEHWPLSRGWRSCPSTINKLRSLPSWPCHCCKFTSATAHKIKYTLPFVVPLFLAISLLTIQWVPLLMVWISRKN